MHTGHAWLCRAQLKWSAVQLILAGTRAMRTELTCKHSAVGKVPLEKFARPPATESLGQLVKTQISDPFPTSPESTSGVVGLENLLSYFSF